MSKKHDANNPYIIIRKNAQPKAFAITLYGVPFACIILALPFPFFRFVFTFGTFIATLISVAAVVMAYEDKNNGVVRERLIKRSFDLPKWFNPAFFLTLIVVSAGLRLGWYLVPICWLLNWACLFSMLAHIEATYEDNKDGQDN